MMDKRECDVAIVGGGLAGLASANALRIFGIEAEVFEQAPALGEIGAAVNASPQAVKALPVRPKLVYVDGNIRIDCGCECEAVVSGDAIVSSIAAASIVAVGALASSAAWAVKVGPVEDKAEKEEA